MTAKQRLILSLDTWNYDEAIEIVERFRDLLDVFKVGFQLFTSVGPKVVEKINSMGKKVFLDLKFHDIPNTVSKAGLTATRLGVYMFDIHTLGGLDMMRRCREDVVTLCLKENLPRPRILGVTILTSIDQRTLKDEIGITHSIRTQVRHLSGLALKAGLDGVIASPEEITLIKGHCGSGFLVVTPGIRPSGTPKDDQRRTLTPREAVVQGADYLVIGRAVLSNANPMKALEAIIAEVNSVLNTEI